MNYTTVLSLVLLVGVFYTQAKQQSRKVVQAQAESRSVEAVAPLTNLSDPEQVSAFEELSKEEELLGQQEDKKAVMVAADKIWLNEKKQLLLNDLAAQHEAVRKATAKNAPIRTDEKLIDQFVTLNMAYDKLVLDYAFEHELTEKVRLFLRTYADYNASFDVLLFSRLYGKQKNVASFTNEMKRLNDNFDKLISDYLLPYIGENETRAFVAKLKKLNTQFDALIAKLPANVQW